MDCTARRVLITGASGLLGRQFLKIFSQDAEWQTLGLAFSRANKERNLQKIDLTNHEEVTALVKDFQPSVILHSAAERRPDVVENDQEKTTKINENATQHLCDLAKEIGAFILFISTDYVFDGTKAPYKVEDATNPLNKYGMSKAEGEKVVLKSSPGNILLRVPILYDEVEFLEESAVTVLLKKVKDTKSPAEMNHCERRYPTLCTDVAHVTKLLIEKRLKSQDICGIFHWSGDEMKTKYDMAVAIAQSFGLPTDHIVAVTKPSTGVPRPYDCHMDCSKLESLGDSVRTPFKEGIKSVLSKYYP